MDLYHSLGFFLPWLWRGKSVVTIHDIHPVLLARHWSAPGNRISYLMLRAHIPLALARASAIITPSAYVKETIAERFRVPLERIVVTPYAVDPFFQAPPAADELRAVEQRLGTQPFFLYAGALAPHKNLAGLVRAFARLRDAGGGGGIRLVVVGQAVGRYRDLELLPWSVNSDWRSACSWRS